MKDKRAANAAKVRTMTVGLAVAGVVGTGALGGLAWAQDHSADGDAGETATTGTGTAGSSSDGSGVTGDGSGTTWPQLSSGSGASHSRSGGS